MVFFFNFLFNAFSSDFGKSPLQLSFRVVTPLRGKGALHYYALNDWPQGKQ